LRSSRRNNCGEGTAGAAVIGNSGEQPSLGTAGAAVIGSLVIESLVIDVLGRSGMEESKFSG